MTMPGPEFGALLVEQVEVRREEWMDRGSRHDGDLVLNAARGRTRRI